MIFSFILWCLPIMMKVYAWRSPKMRELLAEKDFVALIKIKDGSRSRWFRFVGGRIESGSGEIDNPDVLLRFKLLSGADALWVPGMDHAGIATQNVVEKQLKAEGKDLPVLCR